MIGPVSFAVILAVLVIGTILAQIQLGNLRNAVRDDISLFGNRLPSAFLDLERAIGYSGFIHNFKNLVLRYDEGYYITAALSDYTDAMRALDEIEVLSDEANLTLDLSPLRDTLKKYRVEIDLIRQMHEGVLSPQIIDRVVRIDDRAADDALTAAVAELQHHFRTQFQAQVQRISLVIWAISGLSLGLPLLIGGFAFVRHRDQTQKLREFAALNAKLSSANVALQQGNRALSDFAYIASHDLKVPMRGLANHARFLMDDQGGDLTIDGKRRLARMQTLCQHLDGLVDALLHFSEIGRDNPPSPTRLGALIEDLRQSLLENVDGKVVQVSDLPVVNANIAEIRTLFLNLLLNGLTYNTSDAKRAEVGFLPVAERDGTTVENVFYVRDNGIGIDPEYHQDVFRMFKSLHQPGVFPAGPGAGLAYARKIVETYEGDIWLSSHPGRGSVLYFTLPKAVSSAPVAQTLKGEVSHVA